MESLRIEATISSITSISREVSGKEVHPLAVYFKQPSPESTADREAYLECSVHFETNANAQLVSHESLLGLNKIIDQSIASFPGAHSKPELSSYEECHSLIQDVRKQISRVLHEGVPTISDTAKQLGMSGRTLQRRLSEKGYSFQILIDDARRQLSERLLQETNHSLAEIALMIGYSEQSAFTRAFKRWAGQTPRSYRLKVHRTTQKIESRQEMPKRRKLMLVFIYA